MKNFGNVHANILSELAAALHNPGFIASHRTDAKHFTRQRVLTFPVSVTFLLSAWKGGLQTLLDELFETLSGQTERVVTQSAVSQARQKLKASAFEALNALGRYALARPAPTQHPRKPSDVRRRARSGRLTLRGSASAGAVGPTVKNRVGRLSRRRTVMIAPLTSTTESR